MSDSLTTLISKVQDGLGDASGTYFTTAIVTAAAREALKTYNKFLPVNAGTLIDAVSDQYEYELSDSEPLAIKIMDVLLQGDNANEIDISLTYDEYNEDERVFFRLRVPQVTGETLIVRFNQPQTINGLDSATESTIPAYLDPLLIVGISAEALRIRGRSRTETINLSQDQSNNYLKQAAEMKAEFITDLKDEAEKKKAPVSEPDTRAWNDGYHNWGQ